MPGISDRVLQGLGPSGSGPRPGEVAERIGMTPDAFSRALGGERPFSSIELARLADLTGADLHWLITGQPDPHRVRVEACPGRDGVDAPRTDADRVADQQALADIALAYRQAYPDPGPGAERGIAAGSAAAVRGALGTGFARHFADRLEQRLGVEVIRMAELSAAFSCTIGGRPVIAVPATGSWSRENQALAHGLGHLVELPVAEGAGGPEAARREAAAEAFAAELLRSAESVAGVDAGSAGDAEAARRRFPQSLQEAHLERIAAGAIGRATLAWMLGVDAEQLEVDAPEPPEVHPDHLAAALGL
jgi:IrrE N-terminal-like domain